MRYLATTLFALVLSSTLAFANDWGLNQIVGYVDLAEKRLNEGDAKSARSNLDSAQKMVPEASAEAKADKGYTTVQQRIAKLDKLIAAKEAVAAKGAEAVEKLEKADDDETQARIAADGEDYDRASALYKSCSQSLEQAAAIDPAIKNAQGRSGASYAELAKKCKDGSVAVGKLASGEGKVAANTDEGKVALESFAIAQKAIANKKITTLEMSEAIQAAEKCHRYAGTLLSLYSRNNKPVWNGDKDKLGDKTIKEVRDTCTKLEKDLKAKPAFGCGRHYVSVSQWRATQFDKWGPVKSSGAMDFDAMDCAQMPKKTVMPGQSAKFKAKYVSSCGADAIYVIQHSSWLEYPTQRQMSGECWKKGMIKINK